MCKGPGIFCVSEGAGRAHSHQLFVHELLSGHPWPLLAATVSTTAAACPASRIRKPEIWSHPCSRKSLLCGLFYAGVEEKGIRELLLKASGALPTPLEPADSSGFFWKKKSFLSLHFQALCSLDQISVMCSSQQKQVASFIVLAKLSE